MPSRQDAQSVALARQAAKLAERDAQKILQNDVIEQWRALKRLGLYNAKTVPAMKNLTATRRKAIHKHFMALQKHGVYLNGKVRRPLHKEKYITKTGHKKERYVLNKELFAFKKTKKKVKAVTGVQKTRKGYIIEKWGPRTKVRIGKDGRIIEKMKNFSVSRKRYSGKEIIKLVHDIEHGKFHIKDNQFLAYRAFNATAFMQMYSNEFLGDIADKFNRYQKEMPPERFNEWLDTTELVVITGKL